MPKRLLRYALSRLELLDADALDMDNLDFALGRNTVFEFRDVGIKLKVRRPAVDCISPSSLRKAQINPQRRPQLTSPWCRSYNGS